MKLKFTFLTFFLFFLAAISNAQQAPQIVLQPIDFTACPGDSAGFVVQALGDGELLYQWQKDDVDIPGENDSLYFISSSWEADTGSYACVVSNQYGSDTSDAANLLVDIVLPTNIMGLREVENVDTVLYSVVTTTDHTYEFFVSAGLVLESTDTTVLVEWETDTVGYVKVVESSQNGCYGDTVSKRIIIGDVVPFVLSQPVGQTVCLSDSVSFEVVADGTSELNYQWQLDGEDIYRETSSVLSLSPVEIEDGGDYTCVISNHVGSDTCQPAPLIIDLVEPATIYGSNYVDVNDTLTYSIVATEGHSYNFSVTNGIPLASSDTSITVLWDTAGISFVQLVETNTLGCIGDTVNYQVLVFGEGMMVIILNQPASQGVCVDDDVSFSLQAAGYPELIYQWQKDGVDIEDANDSIFSIFSAEFDDEAIYRCLVSNDFGTAVSDEAALDVDEIIPTDILGPQYVSEFEVAVYSVPFTEGHVYEFAVTGGNIIETTENSIKVQWGGSGYSSVMMLESVENGCVGEWVELEIYVGTVGILPEKENSEIVYPNPTANFVHVKLSGKQRIQLYDILGNLVLEKQFEDEIQLNLSQLDQGMYFYRMQDKAGRIVKK